MSTLNGRRLGNTKNNFLGHGPTVAQIGITPKEPLTVLGCKGAIEPCQPSKFRMWVFIDDLEMITEVLTNDKAQGIEKLSAKINNLRKVVPVRIAAFARLEKALKAKFSVLRLGYEFLNSQQEEWRAASVERLTELAELVEALETEVEPVETPEIPTIKKIESLADHVCPLCGRPSFQGKVHLRCEVEKDRRSRRAA